MGDALTDDFDVHLMTGSELLKSRQVPDADYIVTGSMGGLLAMELLPDSCRKLVLISSTAKFCAAADYPCGTPEKILRRMILQLKRDPDAVLDEFFKNVHFPHKESRRSFQLRCDAAANPSHETELETPSILDDLVEGLEYLLNSDVRSKVPTIEIPVLLLHGSEDRIIPSTAPEWLHVHLPDSRLRLFKNDGHALPAHSFGEVMHAIRLFLAE